MRLAFRNRPPILGIFDLGLSSLVSSARTRISSTPSINCECAQMKMTAASSRMADAALASLAAWYAQELALLSAVIAGHFRVALPSGA
jgi:hypothetical protein